MKDPLNWILLAVVGAVGLMAYRKLSNIGAGAQKAAAEIGTKASASVFDFLHPEFRPENYNKPTVVNAQMMGGKYTCPKGYRYKLTARNEHLCFRED